MLDLLEQAHGQGCDLVVYPELALTTFFPRWLMEDQDEIDRWFEPEMPSPVTRPLFDRARELGIAISLGYAELTAEGQHFNTQILTDRKAEIIAKYRKVHLPATTPSIRSGPFSIWRRSTSSPAISDSRSGTRSTGSSGCVYAMTDGGPRPIGSWVCRAWS